MKKIWIAGLAICLSLTSFASCDFLKHEHIALEWQFTELSHWRNSKCTWNKCDIDPMIESHVDDDGDEVCDVCGYVYEGEELPEDFTCPLCGVGADQFTKEEE